MIIVWPALLKLKARLAGLNPEEAEVLATTILGVFIVTGSDHVPPEALNHERIHLAQWKELFYVGFPFIFYGILLWRLVVKRLPGEQALLQHPMEREAYRYMDDGAYLQNRRPFAWYHLMREP